MIRWSISHDFHFSFPKSVSSFWNDPASLLFGLVIWISFFTVAGSEFTKVKARKLQSALKPILDSIGSDLKTELESLTPVQFEQFFYSVDKEKLGNTKEIDKAEGKEEREIGKQVPYTRLTSNSPSEPHPPSELTSLIHHGGAKSKDKAQNKLWVQS